MIEDFDRLSDAQKSLIHALPYRVGLWMSTLEPEGGDVADEAEIKALIQTIEEIARSNTHEFAGYICRQALAHRGRWPDWSDQFARVLNECREAIGLLMRLIPLEDVNDLREVLFTIAASVARAYGERGTGNSTAQDHISGKVTRLLEHAHADGATDGISRVEAQALLDLADSLGLDLGYYAQIKI